MIAWLLPSRLFPAYLLVPLGQPCSASGAAHRGVKGSALELEKLCHFPAMCPWRENLCPRVVAKGVEMMLMRVKTWHPLETYLVGVQRSIRLLSGLVRRRAKSWLLLFITEILSFL